MSRNYKFHNPEGLYFVSFAVVNWLDVFTRNDYKEIVLDSLRFSQKEKGMEIVAWCIMTNHVHLIFRSIKGIKPELLLVHFKEAAKKSSNVKNYQFWRHDNKPIELWSNKLIFEKLNYIHYNPVEAGLVYRPVDYKYSSAIDYADEQGLLENIIVFKYYG